MDLSSQGHCEIRLALQTRMTRNNPPAELEIDLDAYRAVIFAAFTSDFRAGDTST
jgi:hypothetical protein